MGLSDPAATPTWTDRDRFLRLLRNTADIVLALDTGRRVTGLSQPDGQTAFFPAGWIGQRFEDLTSPESRTKIDALFARDVSIDGTQARWRHINLHDGMGGSVPLLLKYAGVQEAPNSGGMLLGRDLRPTVELQDRFRRSHLELESRLEALPAPVASHTGNGNGKGNGNGNGYAASTARAGGAIIEAMITRLGHQPLDGIVAETARVLERLCATEALERSHGDRAAAARLLGISVEDLHLVLLN